MTCTSNMRNFVREHRELYPLLFTADQAKREVNALRSLPIKDVAPGDVVFIHLRYYGHGTKVLVSQTTFIIIT